MRVDLMNVNGLNVRVDKDGFICLTDMANFKAPGAGHQVVKNWIRNVGTIEYLGAWETMHNKYFKQVEFDLLRKKAISKSNSFSLSVTGWVYKTEARGIYTRQGNSGGSFAHKDIAFEFGTWLSPTFKLYLITEYQRLKDQENNIHNVDWNMRRLLTKASYHILTDAVKWYKIPLNHVPHNLEHFAYSEEADMLNLAVFGFTAKQWREAYPSLAAKNKNVREYASMNELCVIASIEGICAEMVKENTTYEARLAKLKDTVATQMKIFQRVNPPEWSLRKNIEGKFQPYLSNDALGMFPEQPREINAA